MVWTELSQKSRSPRERVNVVGDISLSLLNNNLAFWNKGTPNGMCLRQPCVSFSQSESISITWSFSDLLLTQHHSQRWRLEGATDFVSRSVEEVLMGQYELIIPHRPAQIVRYEDSDMCTYDVRKHEWPRPQLSLRYSVIDERLFGIVQWDIAKYSAAQFSRTKIGLFILKPREEAALWSDGWCLHTMTVSPSSSFRVHVTQMWHLRKQDILRHPCAHKHKCQHLIPIT